MFNNLEMAPRPIVSLYIPAQIFDRKFHHILELGRLWITPLKYTLQRMLQEPIWNHGYIIFPSTNAGPFSTQITQITPLRVPGATGDRHSIVAVWTLKISYSGDINSNGDHHEKKFRPRKISRAATQVLGFLDLEFQVLGSLDLEFSMTP